MTRPLGVYTGYGQQLRAAIELASDVEGLRLVLASTVGKRSPVRVSEDGSVVGLWRQLRDDLEPPLGRPTGP